MKAIQISQTGGPEVLSLAEVPSPELAEGQSLVQLEAVGVNFIDTYHRSGLYPREQPFVPGIEGVGRIVESSELEVGDLVAFCDQHSAYAEFAAVDTCRLVRVPDGVDSATACALMVQGLTAHYLAKSTYPLGTASRCLVHAGAGGVGLLLTQIAKRQGAFVYTTVSTEEKEKLSYEAGADVVINYKEQDFSEEVLRQGGPLDVVYDSVGADSFQRSLSILAPRGLMVTFGNSSGAVPEIAPLELAKHGSLFLTRPKLFDYIQTDAELGERAADVFGAYLSGSLSVHIGGEYVLADAEVAHRALESRSTTGKLILRG